MNMKLLFLILIAFVVNANSQSFVCTAPSKVEFDKKSIKLYIKNTSANVKSARIISEQADHTSTKKIEKDETYPVDINLKVGENEINVFGYDASKKRIPNEECSITVEREENPNQSNTSNTNPNSSAAKTDNTRTQSRYFRAIAGIEQVGASSTPSKQQPFFDFFFINPIASKSPDATGKSKHLQFSLWGNVRFGTSNVQGIGALSSFNPATFATNFVQGDSSNKTSDLVESFDFLAGAEIQVFKSKKHHVSFLPSVTSISLIGSVGAITPLSSEKGAVFNTIPRVNNDMDIDPRFTAMFPDVGTQKTVAFVAPERDRFFRQYFGGFRIKSHFLKTDSKTDEYILDEDGNYIERDDIFPAILDITVGQNEAITSKLTGVILRIDGSYPIPIKNNLLSVFGSAQLKLKKAQEKDLPSIFLAPALPAALSDPDVFVVRANENPLFRSNRDTFRFGVGIDLLKLFSSSEDKKKP